MDEGAILKTLAVKLKNGTDGYRFRGVDGRGAGGAGGARGSRRARVPDQQLPDGRYGGAAHAAAAAAGCARDLSETGYHFKELIAYRDKMTQGSAVIFHLASALRASATAPALQPREPPVEGLKRFRISGSTLRIAAALRRLHNMQQPKLRLVLGERGHRHRVHQVQTPLLRSSCPDTRSILEVVASLKKDHRHIRRMLPQQRAAPPYAPVWVRRWSGTQARLLPRAQSAQQAPPPSAPRSPQLSRSHS